MNKFFLFLIVSFYFSSAHSSVIKGLDLRHNKNIEVKLSEKKSTVFYFLSAWCPCSQGTFDHLNKLQKEFPTFNFVGFHSSIAIPTKDALDYFKNYKIDFPIIQDKEVIYADKYKALKTPHVFVYSPKGEVLFQGGATNSRMIEKADKFYLKEALSAIAKGEKPPVEHAKVLGCYIQR
jgi:thiol-disulfide isomerase/thioredoxin